MKVYKSRIKINRSIHTIEAILERFTLKNVLLFNLTRRGGRFAAPPLAPAPPVKGCLLSNARSMLYKDTLYKDQNFPSTERLCSDDVIVTT